jgi:Kef-type K+ transport system membrane component KefB
MTPAALSSTFFLDMAVIIAFSRLVGWVARRWLGQPQVVGEMIAGVLLGPRLLGLLAPGVEATLFPADARKLLYVGAQLGVGLYMFLVGLTFDRAEFRSNSRSALAVGLGGMAAPFAAGALLVPWLLGTPGIFMPRVGPAQAALFLGASIAITAFPMLARIIHERGIAGTPLGTLSLSSGAIGDAGAWVVVALVLASLGQGWGGAMLAGGGGLAFALFMMLAAPRLLAGLERRAQHGVSDTLVALVLVLFLLAAWAMDTAGMHAVFGGFLLGTAMPRGRFSAELRQRLEPFTTLFLLPMFFTFSGLNTRLQVIGDPHLLGMALVIIAVSVLAKGGASYGAARLTGHGHATALGIGALMNARGLMELIIINIGLSQGVIGEGLFAMLVLMAVATTLMASPLFELSRRAER